MKLDTSLSFENPLTVKNAALADGSFSVINSGYEDALPPEYAKRAEDLWTGVREATDLPMELNSKGKFDNSKIIDEAKKVVARVLRANGETQAVIKDVLSSQNFQDAAMDRIISKGLREAGYDGLILKEGSDIHYFKLK